MITKGQVIAILGLLNSMIGATILILPVITIDSGYLSLVISSLCIGGFSFYTCYLIILHLGQHTTIRQSIKAHFNGSHLAVVLYNSVIFTSLYISCMAYFLLSCIQDVLFHKVILALVLLGMTIFCHFYNFGEKLLALGLTTIFLFLLFLVWAFITAPKAQNKQIPLVGHSPIDVIAIFFTAFSVHDFASQIVLQTTTFDKFQKVVRITFVIAVLLYIFIGMSSQAIIGRIPLKPDPQTIEDYFSRSSPQMIIIELIYMVHLMTTLPEFIIVCKIRLFDIFKIEANLGHFDSEQSTTISCQEFVCYIIQVGIIFLAAALKLKFSSVIEFYGAVNGFFILFIIPIGLHLKCIRDNYSSILFENVDAEAIMEQKSEQQLFSCKVNYRNKLTFYLQLLFLLVLIVLGASVLVITLKSLFWGTETPQNDDL